MGRILEKIADNGGTRGRIGIAAAFLLGVVEFRHSCGMTFDNDLEAPRSRAYDTGRDLMQRVFGE